MTEIYERHKRGRQQTGRRNIFFSSFIKIRERHCDIKEHDNNKVIINFAKPKFTITSSYLLKSTYVRHVCKSSSGSVWIGLPKIFSGPRVSDQQFSRFSSFVEFPGRRILPKKLFFPTTFVRFR